MKSFLKRLMKKQDPTFYEEHDSKLEPSLGAKDLLGLGVGMVVGAAIFTLPGIVAADHSGPAVALSFIVGAIGAGLSAFAYAEASSVLPFAGSAFSWINVLFGEFFGWLTGWALLAEYFISVAFVASGWSAYVQGFISSLGIKVPNAIASGFNPKTGGVVDVFAAFAVILIGLLLSRGVDKVSQIENAIVVIKVLVIVLFLIVGFTAIHPSNYVPFIPAHQPGTSFGGFQGVMAGAAQIFLAYVGFDAIAANTAETKNPGKNMPIGIIGTLVIGTTFFVLVSLVLVGMFKYNVYANNAEPAAWALRKTGHYLTANLLSIVAIVGMFAALIGIHLASSRLIYSFGRDGLLPSFLGKVNKHHLPNNALMVVTVAAVVVASVFPFTFLSNLVSAGTLIAFIMVSLSIYALRPREGKDLPLPKFKMPLYPVLPIVSAGFAGFIFMNLSIDAKLLMLGWFVIGIVIYLGYGYKNSKMNQK
ncbi:APC family permease [Lactobacillus sp. Sy-1]|uniref:APC family permease n=1 Tax=Lactobacillus sp. Sy-1 TaxID=2109645 RepID=UPI001C5AB480|nr:amino acid permease [Lactobacillus sp. Sy-1]MBW1606232.1 amino acid permease [Lactobacillus sp. Sy-1]